jgi:formate hydrogenlyase subunit 4
MSAIGLAAYALALVLAPLLPGVVGRTRAIMAGRRGAPLLQPYRDLGRLLRKGAVYSRQTTLVFRAGPVVLLAALALALLLVPLGARAAVAFPADLVVFVALLALARFATVLAALDTGSSFEGMGASRELFLAALTEPALLLALLVVARASGHVSLSAMLGGGLPAAWARHGVALGLAALALFVAGLAENARVPVDDPATHLELTMIHEVMVLDHSGPDLALIEYAAALKLWATSALVASLVVPFRADAAWLTALVATAGVLGVAVAIGLVESAMARLRLERVPQLLVGAGVLAAFALVLVVAG